MKSLQADTTSRTTVRRLRPWACIVALSVCAAASAQTEGSGRAGRLAAYSPSFAKRFALTQPEIPLADGGALQAVEVIPVPTKPGRSRLCDIKLYVDSGMPIELPSSDQSGTDEVTNLGQHFFLADDIGSGRWLKMNEADRRHFGRLQMSRFQLAAVATPDYRPGVQGSHASTPYRSYLREIFPGITYLHLDVPCRWFADLETKYPAMHVWLKRTGGPNYRSPSTGGEMQPKDFIMLDVPNELLRRAKAMRDGK